MGRPRKHDKHLPQSMYRRRGAYYYVKGGKWHPLGRDYGKALTQYAQLVGQPQEARTVRDLLWGCIEHAQSRRHKDPISPATAESYRHSAARLEPVFGHMLPEDLDADMVARYVIEGGTVQHNRDKALLSVAYTYARVICGYRGHDPTKGLQVRTQERPRDRYVTDAELAQVLAKSNPTLALIARFIELTGMRPGDALRVRPGDLQDDGIHYTTGKTGRRIVVGWSGELRGVVDEALASGRQQGREWLFESRPRGKHAARGIGPYTPSGLRSMWRRAREKAGLDDVRLYDLRGKAGSDAATDEEAQARLGHTDGKVTRRHYRRRPSRATPTR